MQKKFCLIHLPRSTPCASLCSLQGLALFEMRLSEGISVPLLSSRSQGRTKLQSHAATGSWRQERCCHLLELGIRDEPGAVERVGRMGWCFARVFPVSWWKKTRDLKQVWFISLQAMFWNLLMMWLSPVSRDGREINVTFPKLLLPQNAIKMLHCYTHYCKYPHKWKGGNQDVLKLH